MFSRRTVRAIPSWTAVWCFAISQLAGVTLVHAADISWQMADNVTVRGEGGHYTREGTATFATGEEARTTFNGIQTPDSVWAKGAATGEIVIRFKDGSVFTVRSALVWNSVTQRIAGIITDGTGRFAGIVGGVFATGEPPSAGPTATSWTGSYQLPPK